jgi:hypothetical protein
MANHRTAFIDNFIRTAAGNTSISKVACHCYQGIVIKVLLSRYCYQSAQATNPVTASP